VTCHVVLHLGTVTWVSHIVERGYSGMSRGVPLVYGGMSRGVVGRG
jgi:hypothetical protein